jgi:hypothetical protein
MQITMQSCTMTDEILLWVALTAFYLAAPLAKKRLGAFAGLIFFCSRQRADGPESQF